VAVFGVLALAVVWGVSRQRRQTELAANKLREMIKERPAQCAAAIDRLLDRIAPRIADPAEVGRRGQELAKLALSTAADLQEAGVGSPYPPFVLNTSSATADACARLIDVEREVRGARIDVGSAAGQPAEDPNAPLYVAQLLRLALEEPRQQLFAQPDAYSGARWAKAVCERGRQDYFLAAMNALDHSGDLAKHFSSLCEVLFATGTRLPVTAAEHASYAAYKQS
jgi:hypothetical protein